MYQGPLQRSQGQVRKECDQGTRKGTAFVKTGWLPLFIPFSNGKERERPGQREVGHWLNSESSPGTIQAGFLCRRDEPGSPNQQDERIQL